MKSTNPELLALAGRIREMVHSIGTQAEAARVSDISSRQLAHYLAAQSIPNFLAVARLTRESYFKPSYVMFGNEVESPRMAPSNARAELALQQLAALVGAEDTDPEAVVHAVVTMMHRDRGAV